MGMMMSQQLATSQSSLWLHLHYDNTMVLLSQQEWQCSVSIQQLYMAYAWGAPKHELFNIHLMCCTKRPVKCSSGAVPHSPAEQNAVVEFYVPHKLRSWLTNACCTVWWDKMCTYRAETLQSMDAMTYVPLSQDLYDVNLPISRLKQNNF